MALQTSGAISLNDMHVEVGGSNNTTCSVNDSDIRSLIDRGANTQQSFNEYYGKSNEVPLSSGGNVNGQAQRQQISASSFISSGGTLRIPSSMWVWSDSRTTAALTVDIPCTIINDGKIIGKGGQGGSGLRKKNLPHPTNAAYNSGYSNPTVGSGGDGGPAINVTSSGVTIINSSGAYICGGGGGGGASSVEPANTFAGGGGGGGGAEGGASRLNQTAGNQIGSGGAINAKGTGASNNATYGGQSGGPGYASGGEDQSSPAGAGGGRIVPGARVNSANYGSNVTVSYGGAGGEAGGNANAVGGYSGSSGGGGGWGAAGGRGYRGAFVSNQCQGGSAGAAITGTSRTLSNSGTIYGGT